jgi:hypothetical protein
MSEWTPYKIGFSASGVQNGRILKNVFHVVHASKACRILEDARLRASLIYDESRLKRSRISVTWLSANVGEWVDLWERTIFVPVGRSNGRSPILLGGGDDPLFTGCLPFLVDGPRSFPIEARSRV